MDKTLDIIDDIIKEIKEHPSYKKYELLHNELKNNKEINKLVEEVKSYQKELVLAKYNNNEELVKEIDSKIGLLLTKLEDYPIYIEYVNIQEDLNNTFQLLKEQLEIVINDITN